MDTDKSDGSLGVMADGPGVSDSNVGYDVPFETSGPVRVITTARKNEEQEKLVIEKNSVAVIKTVGSTNLFGCGCDDKSRVFRELNN